MASSQNMEILSSKDLTISTLHPNSNLNSEILIIGRGTQNIYKSYIYFNLNTFPQNIFLSSAVLKLYLSKNFSYNTPKKIYIYPLIEDFGSYTTYNNQPKYDKTPVIYQVAPISCGHLSINLAPIFQRWISGNLVNKGILITSDEDRYSKMNLVSGLYSDVCIAPKLLVNYVDYSPQSSVSIVDYVKDNFNFSFEGGTAYTDELDLLGLIDGSLIIKNLSKNTIIASLEFTINGVDWLCDHDFTLDPNEVQIQTPKYFAAYYRVKCTADQPSSLNLSYIYTKYK